MNTVRVRSATNADADAIASLLAQLGYAAATAEVTARLDRLNREDRAVVLLAQSGADVVGLATAHILSVLHHGTDVAWLTALVVGQGARRLGVASALVDRVEEFARTSGCARLTVTTREHRSDAQAFYASAGFERTGVRFSKALP